MRDIASHLSIGSTVTSHVKGLSILAHCGREGSELRPTLLELNVDMEWLGGVDGLVWSILATDLVLGVLPAGSRSVAVIVVSIGVWSIAGVWSGLVSILVSLHNVEFWAVSSSNLVGITVVFAIISSNWVSVVILSWHLDSIESSDASAFNL